MSNHLGGYQVLTAAAAVAGTGLAGDSTGDKAVFYLPERCQVLEAGIIPIVNAGSNATTVKFDRTSTVSAQWDTRGDGDVATITTAASPTVGTATRRFVDVQCDKNDKITVEVTDAGAASSTFVAYVKVRWGGVSASDSGDVASS